MLLKNISNFSKLKSLTCVACRVIALQCRFLSDEIGSKYSIDQKEKILQVMNDSDTNTLSGYNISKARIKKLFQWRSNNGKLKALSDVEMIEGFSVKTAAQFFNSILEGPQKKEHVASKIKGKILHPYLSESLRQNCKTVLSVFVTVNSVCWTLIDRCNYEVLEWHYHGIDFKEGKKLLITDILDYAWEVTQKLPMADIYVMKAEATSLRAAGSDPNNPKVIAINLQKAQMIAMLITLINTRSHEDSKLQEHNSVEESLKQKVYFLRPTLPYRLYGTLVGNEKVSTDQTVETLLQSSSQRTPNNSHVYVPESLQNMFRIQKDLEKDMLGHCLLLGITFMDLCIYKNQESISKLVKRGE